MPQRLDLGTLVKKRWPPMSNRQPSRSTVWLMPPTTSVASRTVRVARLAELVGRREAGGPAPMTTTSPIGGGLDG